MTVGGIDSKRKKSTHSHAAAEIDRYFRVQGLDRATSDPWPGSSGGEKNSRPFFLRVFQSSRTATIQSLL